MSVSENPSRGGVRHEERGPLADLPVAPLASRSLNKKISCEEDEAGS